MTRIFFTALLLVISTGQTWADKTLALKKVTEDIYAIVGDLGNRSKDNLGNNATFGFAVTKAGVVLIDSGATYQGAKNIHAIIKQVTDKQIVTVINTGGQDHRWLGNDYFKKLGAQIIASEKAVADQKNRLQDQFIRLGNLVGNDLINQTNPVYADKTFADSYTFKLGKTQFEIYHSGQAHTPGDSYVWLPQQKVMFTGDIVYLERMLTVGTQSNSKSWISAYEAMAAYKPEFLIPGHGKPADLPKAKSDTYDYLTFLRKSVADFMEKGGDISDIGRVDQSAFNYLLNFDSIAGINAQQVFTELEWE